MSDDPSNLTLDKIKAIAKKYSDDAKAIKLDKGWFCPFAKDNNLDYFVSYECYRYLFKAYRDIVLDNNLHFYSPISFHDFDRFMGVRIIRDSRISSNDFGIYYEDASNSRVLHPVLYWTGFRNSGDADSSERKNIHSIIDYTLDIYKKGKANE